MLKRANRQVSKELLVVVIDKERKSICINSLPASEAKASNFTLIRVHVAMDKLLSTARTTYVEIDLRLVVVSGVVEATRKRLRNSLIPTGIKRTSQNY